MNRIDPDDVAAWWIVVTIIVLLVLGVMIGIKYDTTKSRDDGTVCRCAD